MKATRKILGRLIVGCVFACCLSLFTPQTFAIEGLQISVQSSNAVLSWPSLTNEAYLVQYQPTLDSTNSWVTLTNNYSAANDTNVTFFIHSNIVQYPAGGSGGTNGGGSPTDPMMPMVLPANSSGVAVPLAIYPPGFDLTGMMIFDPTTEEWMSGNGYKVSVPSGNEVQASRVQNLDESFGDTNYYTGFYRVVRDGVHIYGLTNDSVLSGEIQFPIEFAGDSTDEIVGVTFYDENNSPIIGASAHGAGNHWTLDWNTTMSFNGDYNVYAELNFASDESITSAPVAVTVNNVISFPNYFSRVYGDEMWIYAQTVPNAFCEIDIYDEGTNYLGSFDDYSDGSGTISFLWNLVDGDDIAHNDDTNFFGVFTVDTSDLSNLQSKMLTKSVNTKAPNFQTVSLSKKSFSTKFESHIGGVHPNSSGSAASANQLWVKEGNWAPNNNWVVAYAPLNTDPNTTYKESLMMLGGPDGNDGGVIGTLSGNDFHGNLSPGNVPQTSAFELADATSRTNLLSYLADYTYENFYYFGHGNNSVISAYKGTHTAITKDQIAFDLGNIPLSDQILHAALHPYRFVFLDGCDTGKGSLCESFGIPAITVSTNFFAAAGVESRAFLGYTHEVSFNVAQWDWRAFMLGGFLADWESGLASLQTCRNRAVSGAYGSGIQPMDSSAVIYGAVDMFRSTRTRP